MDPGRDKFGDEKNDCCCRFLILRVGQGQPVLPPEDIWPAEWWWGATGV